MKEQNIITCPNCGTEIDVQDIISHQLEEDLKKEFNAKLSEEKKKFDSQAASLKKEKKSLKSRKKKRMNFLMNV